MKWTIHGEREIYTSEWVGLSMVDVELPDGTRLDHHVVRSTGPAAGVVADVAGRGILLLWRHRFITDSWGYEIPAGKVDVGETPIDAAARECLEETGWRPGTLRPLTSTFPTNGLCDQRFDVFVTDEATHTNETVDPNEADRIEWLSHEAVRSALASGEVRDGLSFGALSYHLLMQG